MLEWSLSIILAREGFNQAEKRLHLEPYRAKSLRTEFQRACWKHKDENPDIFACPAKTGEIQIVPLGYSTIRTYGLREKEELVTAQPYSMEGW